MNRLFSFGIDRFCHQCYNGVTICRTPKGCTHMKIKNALISTVATVSALGVIGSFAGGNDTAAEPMDTVAESHSVEVVILEPGDYPPGYTLDITTQIETEPPAPVTQPPESEPPAPVTQPPVVTEAPKPVTPPPVVTEAPKQALDILSVSSPIKGGQNATLSAKGKPNTAYDIKVVYSSGESSAKGLEDKTSDANGNVSWTWKVGAKTKPGTYTITVKGGGETDTIKITVTD